MFYSPSGTSVAPSPPKAIGGSDSPPQRALPIDVSLSRDPPARGTARPKSTPFLLRETCGPLAIGGDTWNAFSAVPLQSNVQRRRVVPPKSVDAVPVKAPKPLWCDLAIPSPFKHHSVPIIDAFRAIPAEKPSSRPVVSAPVPPQPISTSPLRAATAASEVESANTGAPLTVHRDATAPLLVPIGESAPATLLTTALQHDPSNVRSETPVLFSDTHLQTGPSSPNIDAFVPTVTVPSVVPEDAPSKTNRRNFFSTLFSTKSESSGDGGFNALELVTNRSSQWRPALPTDYSTYFSTTIFDEDGEDNEEALESLYHVISVALQSTKTQETATHTSLMQNQQTGTQPDIHRTDAGGFSSGAGKYTESSSSFCNSAPNSSEWQRYAFS